MRILVVFIDMLRPDLCRTFEPTAEGGPIDGFFDELGGDVFRAAYTPAPVTTRSIASFWTGLYPAKTGCTRIARWPRDFVPDSLPTLFSEFGREGYSLHCFLNRNEKAHGLLPGSWQARVQMNDDYDLEAFLKTVPKRDDQLVFVSLIDVHWFMTDHGYTRRNFQDSQKIPVGALARANRVHPFEEFDEIVVFSDHGFQEGGWADCPWQDRLSRSKTGIALAWRSKSRPGNRSDLRLRSIMDVVPTLIERAGLPRIVSDGLPLTSTEGHAYIAHEDMMNILLSTGPHAEVDMWGATFDDGYFAFHDEKVHLTSERQSQLLHALGPQRYVDGVFELIARHSPSMLEYYRDLIANRSLKANLDYFHNNGGYPDSTFADGTPINQWQSFVQSSRSEQ